MAATEPALPGREDARIALQPIAAPAVLGWFSLASGLIIFGTWFAGSWGDPASPKTFFTFILLFSGVGQLGAALLSFRARDAVSASIHGSWAAFWLGWGVMWILAAAGTISIPRLGTQFSPLGMWFLYLAVITWTTAFAALAVSPGQFLAQATLGSASAIAAAALLLGSPGWEELAGWLFVATAAFGYYIGAAIMLDNVYGMKVLPLLRWGGRLPDPVQYEHGDPGVKVGQ